MVRGSPPDISSQEVGTSWVSRLRFWGCGVRALSPGLRTLGLGLKAKDVPATDRDRRNRI